MTTILVDTQIFLWMQGSPARLRSARELIEDENTTVLFSAASSWGIAIKWRIGKLPLPEPPHRYIPDRMQRSAIQALPVLHSHALAVAELPGHHDDPFDRLLIAQALLEGIALVTADPALRAYGAELIWVG
jgi:PIN domain nuclease of toxin-antitoxin system